MDFTALTTEVYSITNRSDLTAETQLAVKSATLKAHNSENYFKDLYETVIAFNPSDYVQSIEYRALIPKYRSLKYLAKFDADSNTVGKHFEILPPELLVDSYGINKEDVCYVAGAVIQVKSSTQDDYMSIGCYVHPTVDTTETYSSWIAAEFPYAIVYEAAAQMFSALGNTTKRDHYRSLALEEITIIRGHNLVAQGY